MYKIEPLFLGHPGSLVAVPTLELIHVETQQPTKLNAAEWAEIKISNSSAQLKSNRGKYIIIHILIIF
jgi:hypothetical protein